MVGGEASRFCFMRERPTPCCYPHRIQVMSNSNRDRAMYRSLPGGTFTLQAVTRNDFANDSRACETICTATSGCGAYSYSPARGFCILCERCQPATGATPALPPTPNALCATAHHMSAGLGQLPARIATRRGLAVRRRASRSSFAGRLTDGDAMRLVHACSASTWRRIFRC